MTLRKRIRKIEGLKCLDDLLAEVDESDADLCLRFWLSLSAMEKVAMRQVFRKRVTGGLVNKKEEPIEAEVEEDGEGC